jgi:hypothetical protein
MSSTRKVRKEILPTTINSQGDIAGDITQNDQENEDKLINSNSEGEGEYRMKRD